MIKVSLIITTYNWPEALQHVLLSAFDQSVEPTEIIVADDGSRPETKYLIERFQETSPVPLKQVWHEDSGFRRTVILNKAIGSTTGDYIVQIDGDVSYRNNSSKIICLWRGKDCFCTAPV